MNIWLPIESAPKDKPFLGACGKRIAIYQWDSDQYSKKPRPYFRSTFQVMRDRANQPEFWRHLPEPPQ